MIKKKKIDNSPTNIIDAKKDGDGILDMKVSPAYEMKIKIGQDSYDLQTDDIVEGLLSFKPNATIKVKPLVFVTQNGKTVSKLIPNIMRARHIFSNRMAAQIFAKNLTTLLKY